MGALMHMVVKQSILERAISAVQKEQETGKEVEKVLVNASEMEAMLNCPVGPNKDDILGQRSCFKDHELYVAGVPVRVEKPKAGDLCIEIGHD